MNQSLKLGGAFIGLMVGVGFSSGREILMFFTSFGYYGLLGGLVSSLLFIFMLSNLFKIGKALNGASHKQAIHHICGKKVGVVVDIFLTFGLFGGMTVMLAGAGSSFEQQMGMPHWVGGMVVGIAAIITVCLGLKQVIRLMSSITPVLIVIVAIVAIYAFTHINKPLDELVQYAVTLPQSSANWFVSALLYVSFNIAGCSAVVLVLGASADDAKKASMSGVVGGVGIGILIFVMTMVLLTQVDVVAGKPIPTLLLSNMIAPWFGYLMLTFLMVKLFCTTVGLTYGLSARIREFGVPYKPMVAVMVTLSYLGSLFGFVALVKFVYPLQGYLGFLLMACIILYWFRQKRGSAVTQAA